MKNSLKYFPIILIIALASFTQAQKPSTDKDLPNFYSVNQNLYRGAQPTEQGVKDLAKMGVKTIINLRGDEDRAKNEEIWAKNSGIKFINVNLSNWFKPKTSDIESIIKDINTAENQPVFVHCQRGADRTGTVIAIYRITHDNWTAKQAIDEAKKFNFGWWQFWMKDYINDYYKDFQSKTK